MPSGSPSSLLGNSDVVVRVSSTLDKSVGKKYLTDGDNETCWTSANGLPQSITLSFPSPILPSSISLTFAGGFVGTHCSLSSSSTSSSPKYWVERARFYPADSNRTQDFALDIAGSEEGAAAAEWKVEFEKGSDFFGRITLYDLQFKGWKV